MSQNNTRVHHFTTALLSGSRFHGHCAEIRHDDQSVSFIDRRIPRYSFEPEETKPRVEVLRVSNLDAHKTEVRILAAQVKTPQWFHRRTNESSG